MSRAKDPSFIHSAMLRRLQAHPSGWVFTPDVFLDHRRRQAVFTPSLFPLSTSC